MAAGVLLVREAGGFVTDPGGEDPRDTGDVVAANPHLHAGLQRGGGRRRDAQPAAHVTQDDGSTLLSCRGCPR